MTGTLKVITTRPFPIEEWLGLAANELKKILHVNREFKIGIQIPRGVPFVDIPPIVPSRPGWGLYFYVDGVDDSLVEAHLGNLRTESGEEAVSLQIHERRTPASKALAASLAVAAAQLLNTDIIDDERVWTASERTSPHNLEQQLAVSEEQTILKSALDEFIRRMHRVD